MTKCSLRTKKFISQKNNILNKQIDYIDSRINEIAGQSDEQKYVYYLNLALAFKKQTYKQIDLLFYKQGLIKNINYSIVKETSTNTWFFTCPSLMVMYLTETDYIQFKKEYENSFYYKFYILKTEFDDCDYIVICASHDKSSFKNSFLVENNCRMFYFVLSDIINSFVIINTGFLNYITSKKTCLKLLNIHSIIGNGKEILEIGTFVQHMVKIINTYNKFLPLNYLLV